MDRPLPSAFFWRQKVRLIAMLKSFRRLLEQKARFCTVMKCLWAHFFWIILSSCPVQVILFSIHILNPTFSHIESYLGKIPLLKSVNESKLSVLAALFSTLEIACHVLKREISFPKCNFVHSYTLFFCLGISFHHQILYENLKNPYQ